MAGAVLVIAACALVSLVYSNTIVQPVGKRETTVCYARVGCFSTGPPFSTDRLFNLPPDSPDTIRTRFLLFTRANKYNAQVLDARYPDDYVNKWTNFKSNKPLKIVTHGFLDRINLNLWQNESKDALLTYADYNVVLVDWSLGNLPPYTQATGNTRLVGAQIADLIKTLQSKAGYPVKDVHLIGHSLGAHISGYAGERVPGLGRISGLDPAGPYFDNADPAIRLDETDAEFVDVLHSDAQSLLFMGMGIKQRCGHVDFYPNFGRDQPGCDNSPIYKLLSNGFLIGTQEVVACNHLRSIKFFIESINTHCPYMAYPCSNEDDFKAGNCYSCGNGGCSRMGFHADKVKPHSPTLYYLSTSDAQPFCEYHLTLLIQMADRHFRERGHLKIQIFGSKGSSKFMLLNDSPRYLQNSRSYSFYVGTPSDLGDIKSINLGWHHDAHRLKPWEYNPLGLRRPTVYVDRVLLRREETHQQTELCLHGVSIATDRSASTSSRC